MKKDSICQVDVINQQNVTTATNYLEKEKVQKSLRILSKFTDNKQIGRASCRERVSSPV